MSSPHHQNDCNDSNCKNNDNNATIISWFSIQVRVSNVYRILFDSKFYQKSVSFVWTLNSE